MLTDIKNNIRHQYKIFSTIMPKIYLPIVYVTLCVCQSVILIVYYITCITVLAAVYISQCCDFTYIVLTVTMWQNVVRIYT